MKVTEIIYLLLYTLTWRYFPKEIKIVSYKTGYSLERSFEWNNGLARENDFIIEFYYLKTIETRDNNSIASKFLL